MRDQHIIGVLESTRFASLSESDHSAIRAHSADCDECARAYKVALVSTSLLQDRMAETIEPTPFFYTRVMAAIREKQNDVPAFARMWRAAGALVSSMAAAVLLFAVLSFAVSGEQTLPSEVSASTRYSAESLILDETDETLEQASDAQVLNTLYAVDDDAR
jgi:anti-sigma factor RsiW